MVMDMEKNDLHRQIIEAIEMCSSHRNPVSYVDILPYETNEKQFGSNEFIFMLKPELTLLGEGVRTDKILTDLFEVMQEWDIRINSCCVMSGSYLKENRIIENHYRVLNRISRLGWRGCATSSQKRLMDAFKLSTSNIVEIYGAFEFMDKFPNLTPDILEILNSNIECKKIGNGFYAVNVIVEDKAYIILNAFHPAQVQWFTKEQHSVVVFACTSDAHFPNLRKYFFGTTAPEKSPEGTLRSLLLKNKNHYGLDIVSTRLNGFHMSPGNLEGMYAIKLYFGRNNLLTLENTIYGRLLKEHGVENAEMFIDNPEVPYSGSRTPIFDLTEDLNWDESIVIIQKALREMENG